jgi:hypothetical protein
VDITGAIKAGYVAFWDHLLWRNWNMGIERDGDIIDTSPPPVSHTPPVIAPWTWPNGQAVDLLRRIGEVEARLAASTALGLARYRNSRTLRKD